MNPQRWKQVDRVLQKALSQPPERLAHFLDEACASDGELRREVESLLEHEKRARESMGPPDPGSLDGTPAVASGPDLAGRTLLHYRIVQKIGEGGMGVVYEAEDRKLGRRVAIKLLAESLSGDRERIARLHREAKLLASLSHPNVAAIYGLEEVDGTHFLALELVEGRTLADRLKKGPLPLQEAVEVCLQIAEGLEAAHEKGIVHRDLKPGNVMLTPDGKVKILDFGLARVFREEGAGDLGADAEHSPTITEAMTRPGVVLGTAAYMSPEQAKGKPVDKRADIWGFGCVLYECLTGKRAFHGETITETVASVLRSEPDWTLLPAETPAIVSSLLLRCLRKDPALRLHDIADARIEIGESAAEAPEAVALVRRLSLPWLVAGGVIILLAGLLAGRFVLRPPHATPRPAIVRSVIKVEPGHRFTGNELEPWYKLPTRTAVVMSNDSRFIVYCGTEDNPGSGAIPRLYIRRMDQPEGRPISGTEGGTSPFLSPDDRWVGFWADRKLKKVSIGGGVAVNLCDSEWPFGANWGRDNNIVFSPHDGVGLFSISAEGGKAEALTTPKREEEQSHRLPRLLPDGSSVLFTIMRDWSDLQPRVALLDLKTRRWRILIEDAADARYVPTGHLVFLRQGTLLAVPFDLERLEVTGQPVPTINNIMQALNYTSTEHNTAAGQFTISDAGWLLYASGGIIPDWENALVWVDQKGNEQPDALPKGPVLHPSVSPDGRRVAYSTLGRESRVWIYDLVRGTATRLTDEGKALSPSWTPDGKRVVFGGWRSADIDLYWQPVDGSSPMERLRKPERLTTSAEGHLPGSWSPDGATLAYVLASGSRLRILMLDMQSRRVTPFPNSRANEGFPEFSPDGRWLAYASDESGPERWEVYVRPFPGPGGRWQISQGGGSEPLWARSGKQLFYRWGEQVWVVDVRTDAGFAPGKPRLLFERSYGYADPLRGWDISPDGQRFLMVKLEERKPQPVTEMILVQNWFEELKRLCPTGKN